jgi:predicted ArsR family transcriptional regulator
MTPDTLNDIGVLKRREIEARILAPLLEAFGERFGKDEVLEVAREVIIKIAQEQGAALAERMGGDSLEHFADSLANWTKDNALEIQVVAQDEQRFHFNVTRCRYAELYRALGVPELGALFSCNRDATLIQGFNPNITFTRTQTIMEGAPFCDFRYERKKD